MANSKLSKFQKLILAQLHGRDCITVQALREHFAAMTATSDKTLRASLSRSLSRLQDRGLLERVSLQVGTRRAPAVRLTKEELTVSENLEESVDENKEVSGRSPPFGLNVTPD